MSSGIFTHYLEQKRLAVISPFLQGKIVDIGCGYASFIRRYNPSPAEYIGIEKSKVTYDWLCSHYPQYSFINSDVEFDNLPDLSGVGCVVSLAVLEHLKYPDRLLKAVYRILPPHKPFIFTTPAPLGGRLHDAGSRIGLFSTDARNDHQGFYSRSQLVELLEAEHYKVMKFRQFLMGLNQLVVCTKA